LSETTKIENRLLRGRGRHSHLQGYQVLASKFHYCAEQWNFEPEQRNFGLASSQNSVDIANINEKSANP
jgi:hypothetical protein